MKKIFRFLKFQGYKLIRIKDFPESVAIGLAWGAAVSVTPILGLHLIVCYLGTWIMRGNIIVLQLEQLSETWTFPLFFIWTIKLEFFYKESIVNYELKVKFLFENFEALFPNSGREHLLQYWFKITYYLTKNYLVKRFDEKNKTRG